jgi:hypothetical protein
MCFMVHIYKSACLNEDSESTRFNRAFKYAINIMDAGLSSLGKENLAKGLSNFNILKHLLKHQAKFSRIRS